MNLEIIADQLQRWADLANDKGYEELSIALYAAYEAAYDVEAEEDD